MDKNVFSERQVGSSRKNSGAMRNLMKKGRIGKVLSEHREQDAFFRELKNRSQGGITRDEFRETLGALAQNKNDSISTEEVRRIGHEMESLLGDKRTITPKEKKEAIKNLSKLAGKKEKEVSNKKLEAPKPAPNLKNSVSLKDASRLPIEEISKEHQSNALPSSRFGKGPSKKATSLLNDILDKKSA